MRVPFRLRRRPEAAPATAVLLPSHRPEDLVRLCARLGLDPLPPVYPVTDGFLLRLPRPVEDAIGRVIRLRELTRNLLLPADAELVPGLLADEAAALVSRRGLVFLPGERVLEFAPGRPLPLASLVGVDRLERRPWKPPPAPPALAERITEIVQDIPHTSPEAILEAGGEGIGTEEPRPADSGLPSKVLGKTAFGIGKGMAWLGNALHLRGLARAGAKWMAGAMALVPRLSESLLGRQQAALRDLLREFRTGNVERALRHALPIGDDTERGAVPSQSARLPTHNLRYSLHDLLGGGGRVSVWFDPSDVFRELRAEYRKQAELATRNGDYRRAAFIYGKLLGDYRLAASVLARGGLHADAAVLYLAKVGDTLAAAREFEAAGDIDRALDLYRQRGEHELAGDLLRRVGEEELAVAEYQRAAEQLLAGGQGYYRAGEMLLNRAKRADLARTYYQAGWARRPEDSPTPCAVRLAQLFAHKGAVDPLLRLITEAEQFFGPPGNEGPAAEFYNEVARLAEQPALAQVRGDLRDRALLGIAGKLRQRVDKGTSPANLVSALLGQSSPWPTAVVSDAQFAVRAAPRRPPVRTGADTTSVVIQARVRVVRAVCRAPETGDIFLGFQSGEAACFRPHRGEVVYLPAMDYPVTSLATTDKGDIVAVLRMKGPGVGILSTLSGYRTLGDRDFPTVGEPWLCPVLAQDDDLVAGLWNGERFQFLRGPWLLPIHRHLDLPRAEDGPEAVLFMPSFGGPSPGLGVLAIQDDGIWYFDNYQSTEAGTRATLGWDGWGAGHTTLKRPVLTWLHKGGEGLELAGIGPSGSLFWADLAFGGGGFVVVACRVAAGPRHCLAATLLRPGLAAVVTPTSVQVLRCGASGFSPPVSKTDVSLPGAVACFFHHWSSELIVVSGDGTVTRVPLQKAGAPLI